MINNNISKLTAILFEIRSILVFWSYCLFPPIHNSLICSLKHYRLLFCSILRARWAFLICIIHLYGGNIIIKYACWYCCNKFILLVAYFSYSCILLFSAGIVFSSHLVLVCIYLRAWLINQMRKYFLSIRETIHPWFHGSNFTLFFAFQKHI